jgi:hypothetical protein
MVCPGQPATKEFPVKFTVHILVCLTLVSLTAFGGGIHLSVKPGKTNRDSAKRWHTDNGSYRKDFSESKAIEIRVRNNGATDQVCTVEWFFVAEPLDGGEEWIYDSGKKVVPLAAGEEKEFEVVSGEVLARDVKVEFANAREQAGGEYDGYLVVAHAGGEVDGLVCSKASRAYEEKVVNLAKQLKLKDAEKKKDGAERSTADAPWGGKRPARSWRLKHRAKEDR